MTLDSIAAVYFPQLGRKPPEGGNECHVNGEVKSLVSCSSILVSYFFACIKDDLEKKQTPNTSREMMRVFVFFWIWEIKSKLEGLVGIGWN